MQRPRTISITKIATRSAIVLGGTAWTRSFRCSHRRNLSESDPATKEVMKSALIIQSTFLDISRSVSMGHPHSALELHLAKTTTSAWKLEAYLQASPVEQFPENRDIVEQSAGQVASRGPRECPQRFQSKRWRWSDLIPTSTDSMVIILSPEVTIVGDEHTLAHKTYIISPQNVT
jgi:hypothetical protein